MSDFTLEAISPVDGFRIDGDGFSLAGIGELGILSLSVPRTGKAAASRALKAACGLGLPETGGSAHSPKHGVRLLALQPDLYFLIGADPARLHAMDKKLGAGFYLTDQSDAWCAVSLSGARCRQILERLISLDVHPDAFAQGRAARTVADHVAVIVLRDGPDAFLLLSPSSSASSFLESLRVVARNAGHSAAPAENP